MRFTSETNWFEWSRRAAENGYPAAQYDYAEYLSGGVENDGTPNLEFLEWAKKAAVQNYLPAVGKLMTYYMSGDGTNMIALEYWYTLHKTQIQKHKSELAIFNIESLEPTFEPIRNCRTGCLQLIHSRKRGDGLLASLPKDIVVYIAKIVWTNTYEETFRKIKCPNRCKWEGCEIQLFGHLNHCPNRELKCHICGLAFMTKEIAEHTYECGMERAMVNREL